MLLNLSRVTAGLALAISAASCAAYGPYTYPSDYHLYDELKSFRAPPLEQVEGNSYRLILHEKGKNPAAVLANCASECRLELRYTDGAGTYHQGKLDGLVRRRISVSEFNSVASAFQEGNFSELEPDLREDYRYASLMASKDTNDPVLCLHTPHYYLESYVDGVYKLIYRYCQIDYYDNLKIALPLIRLAQKYFPASMRGVIDLQADSE